ncbi:hypothetical protein QTP88_013223 [Uroleucon formosanum]
MNPLKLSGHLAKVLSFCSQKNVVYDFNSKIRGKIIPILRINTFFNKTTRIVVKGSLHTTSTAH